MGRSNLAAICSLIKDTRLTKDHIHQLEKTPFWPLFAAFLLEDVQVKNVRKNENDISKIIETYDPSTKAFNFGEKKLNITNLDVEVIFGITCGNSPIDLAYNCAKPTEGFASRRCKDVHQLKQTTLKTLLAEAVLGDSEEDAKDVARIFCLYAIHTIFFPTSGTHIKWGFLKYVEDVEEIRTYAWSDAIRTFLMEKIDEKHKTPQNVTGCVVLLPFWLCEHAKIIESRKKGEIPRFVKWDLMHLHGKIKGENLTLLVPEILSEDALILTRAEDQNKQRIINKWNKMITCINTEVEMNSKEEELNSIIAELRNDKLALSKELDQAREEVASLKEQNEQKTAKEKALTAVIEKFKKSGFVADLDSLIIESKALKNKCSDQVKQIHMLHSDLAAAAAEKLKTGEETKRTVATLELQVIEGEKLRKKLHNTIMELKGNIRVFCRVRPLLPNDAAQTEATVISYPTSTESLGQGIDLIQSGKKHSFTFDKVFNHEASQQDVFVEISQLIQSALDGYKVCIFAYGQTGSGKTYTMMGGLEPAEQKGLIPRCLEQIFQTSQSLSAQGWRYKIQVSILEIYNETIRDLLSTNQSSSLDVTHEENRLAGKHYAIKHDPYGNTHVFDLTIVDVCSIKETSLLLQKAAQRRSVGRTQMNEQSSRSHFVFTLQISGVNESTEQQVQGVLNLIDLAGSERISKSGCTGDRLKETQAINKSLSSLADVLIALSKKDEHIPFRNSKLTYLLQPCLGGDSKTLMFVNISPDPLSVGESLYSLRFAARVNSVEIGIPSSQTRMWPPDSHLRYG